MVEVSLLSRHILRDLCMDSRVTITELAEKYTVSRHVVKERIEALEREFALRYTIEPNYMALGFTEMHLLRMKFNKKPKPADLASIFAKSRVAQLVFTAKGDFDGVIFAVAKSPMEYSQWETALYGALSKYGANVVQSETNIFHLGFIPLDDKAIEASNLEPIYKKMLGIINDNSRISIRDLSKEMGVSEALTRYYFRELDKLKLIKRYTTVVTKSPMKYNIVYFGNNYIVKPGIQPTVDRERRTMYWKQLPEFPVISEYPISLSASGGDRFFTWANYNDYEEGLKLSIKAHVAAYREDEPKMALATVENVIKGFPPIRNIDQKETYGVVDWTGGELI